MPDGADQLREAKSFAAFRAHENGGRPVFLHGLWRSGSTYLWSRFRVLDAARCFYEPLHHGLAKLTPERIARDTPEKIGANRHPALDDPYFLEFAPLIEKRGVRAYREDLAYDRFAIAPHEPHPRLHRYIEGLVDHAEGEGRSPVLGFNRTSLRIAWLKDRFPSAYNVLIDRDPGAVWASYRAEMAKGNYAFFSMWLRVLIRNADHPLFAPLVERLGLHRRLAALAAAKSVHREIMDAMSEAESYFMIYYLWLACAEHGRAECDLVIDTERADSARYRRVTALQIAEATGLEVDLSDMRKAKPRGGPPSALRAHIEHSAQTALPFGAVPKTPLFRRWAPGRLIRDSSLFAGAV